MSDKVVLLADGKVVKLIGKDYTISTNGIGYYSIDGSLLKFDLINSNGNSIQYIYLNETDFYKSDQIGDFYIKPAENGYYKFEEVEIYRNSNDNERYRNLKKFLLSYQMLTFAQIGDLIEIRKVEFQSPYTSYYKYFEYKFKIQQLHIDFLDSAQYPSIIDNDPNSPTYNIKSDKSFDYLLNPEGESNFFITNFKNQINNIPENKKAILAKAMTLICFRIYHIMKDDILDIIAIEDINVIKYTENPSMLYHQVDQFIWELMKSWGFLGGFEASHILEDKTINAFESYYEGLLNLYKFFYLRDENKLFGYDAFGNPLNENGRPITVIPAERKKVDSERRLSYIIEVLPPSTIALLSYDIKEQYLLKLMNKDSLSREEQGYVLNIVYSFVETIDLHEREKFLDFLLIKENGKDTNFNVLLQRMDDKIVSYVLPTISNIFDPEESNKGNFCLALQRIWKNSKYNFYHIPGGTVANEDGMNPNAYFLNEGLSYFDVEGIQIVFDFDTVQTDSWPNYQGHPGIGLMQRIYEKYYAHKQLDGERIEITKKILFNYSYLNQDGREIEDAPSLNRQEKYHFKLHLFQPISIIGYKPHIDSQVTLPEEPYLPAFLFYYQEEFDRLRKKYAQYSFAIDVAVEAILFFTPVVVANIRHLRHLRHVTKIGNAFRQGQSSSEVVYVWKGLTPSSSETFSLLASVCFSFQTYVAAAADDENEREFANEVANIFLLLTLLGVGASLVTRIKLTHSAKEVVNNPKFSTLPSDVRPVITKLAGSIDEAIDAFRTKLNNWPSILSKFNNPAWDDAIRNAFYADFKNLSDTDLGKLNDFPASLDNWKDLFDLNINERAIIDLITKQNRVNAIKKCYSFPEIREVLEPLENNKKWKFLDDFGEQPNDWFDFLKDNPSAINRWNNLNGKAKLFARNHPEEWLYVYDRFFDYPNPPYGLRLSTSEILGLFEQRGLDLVNNTETQALIQYSLASSNNARRAKAVTSGGNCNITGETIIKNNWTDDQLKEVLENGLRRYDNYLNSMFPTLRKRVDNSLAFGKENYFISENYNLGQTGNFPGGHAEIQVVDELAKLRFPDYLSNPPSDEVFDAWLKNNVLMYNRTLMVPENSNDVIMYTCADCFHILYGVKFINNF